MKNKIILSSILLIVLILGLSAISATDTNTTTITSIEKQTIDTTTSQTIDNKEKVIVNDNKEVKSNIKDTKTEITPKKEIKTKEITTQKQKNKEEIKTTNKTLKKESEINYYVSNDKGSDTNDGSIDKPYKTINQAITQTTKDNTYNIHISTGTYTGVGNTNLTVNGDYKINFIGDGINKTIIDGEVNYTVGKASVWGNDPYFNNYDLVENKNGMLFVPGSAGIYVVDKKDLLDGKEVEYQLLNSKSGLENALTPNAWNYVDQDENLYFSTDNGVTCMNLNHYNASTRSYRMQMKSVEIDGARHSVKRGEPLYVERGAETIEIFPEIINYSVYKPYVSVYLEGYDKAPKVMQQGELSSVIYTNLPVGSYTFHLAVLDSKDQSVQVESTYQIIKKAEIYDNWWFMLYMVAVFAIAVTYLTWLVFHTQVQRTLNIQKRELELVKKQLEMGNETVLTIARTVDAKDVNTSQHSARVAEYSVMIGKELGFDEQKCSELKRAALLHDIGKIGIPDRILNKPERLTDEEYKEMKSHVVKGGEILKSFTLIDNIEEGALYHHERYDGKGYVHGLKGEEIPLNARIIGIADAFDAMTANRVYRKKLDMDFVLGELKKGRGTQFDPQLTDIMLHLIETGQIDMQRLYDNANVKEEEE